MPTNHTASQWSVWSRNSYLTASHIFPLLTTSGLLILRRHQTTTVLTACVETDVQLSQVFIFRIKVSGFYMVSTTKQVVVVNLQTNISLQMKVKQHFNPLFWL